MENIFLQMALADRAQLLWNEGRLLADRNCELHRITLYRLFSFYVEVICDLDFTTIEEIRLVEPEGLKGLYDLPAPRAYIKLDY